MTEINKEDLIFLTTVSATVYPAAAKRLREAGIPFDFRDEPLHAYDPGNFGYKRIYVDQHYLMDAKRLLGVDDNNGGEHSKDELVSRSKNPVFRILRWLLLLSLLTPFIGYLLIYLLRVGMI